MKINQLTSILILLLSTDGMITRASTPLLDFAELKAVPFTDVKIADSFWAPRRETNRVASIPVNIENLYKTGTMANFDLAGRGATNGFNGQFWFMDSDAYKALEAIAYSLSTDPDPELDKKADQMIGSIASAQQKDGYLNTWFTVKAPGKRWTDLRDAHELYCAGHMIEAAVAHFQATGKRTFLDVAVRKADLIDSVFGPTPKRMGYPGHPELELALVKLWRATGEKRYLDLARFFVVNRGQKFFAKEHNTPLDRYDGTYWQDDIPIYDHTNIKGHAVRAAYLMSGATDVAGQTRDEGLLRMLRRVWRNTTERNMYITGGIGPSAHNEGFTHDYDLPNLTAYQETCASVALAQWNHRLALLYGDSQYADVMERSLYNGVLAGVALDGTKFFYVNPLESRGSHHRSPWFGCACCPPNVARTLASIGGYAYAVGPNSIWVNLYIQGSAQAKLQAREVKLNVATDYPWDGKVIIRPEIQRKLDFELRLRMPSWCQNPSVQVNGRKAADLTQDRGYLVISRTWQKGDRVELDLPMPVDRVISHPAVAGNRGLMALQRGPLVYCMEAADNGDGLDQVYLSPDSAFKPVKEGKLLGGVTTLSGKGYKMPQTDWDRRLYQSAAKAQEVSIKAIPYNTWDNRRPGFMRVWFPTTPPQAIIGGLESKAKVSLSFKSANAYPEAINDGKEPKSSGDHPGQLCHWWPHRGNREWVQYNWDKPVVVSGSKIYWFDDSQSGGCNLPSSWQIEALNGGEWRPVSGAEPYKVEKDKWNEVRFEPVKTTALRLSVELQKDWAAGIHEWKVLESEED